MAPVDYSKWDFVDSDEDDEEPKRPPAPTPSYVDRRAHHDESQQLIAAWLREADGRLSEPELARLMKFIAVQHRGIHETNVMRHQEIVAFLEAAAAAGTMPSLHVLLNLGRLCKERLDGADKTVAGQAERILLVAMGAINTLAACDAEGGARALFEKLLRPADADERGVVEAYKNFMYAVEVVKEPPDDPRDAPPPPPERSWLQKLGRACIIQIGVALLSMALATLMMGTAKRHGLLPAVIPPESLGEGASPPDDELLAGTTSEP